MDAKVSANDVTRPRPQPNKPWVCGYSELGVPCAHGPTGNGKCGLLAVKKKKDDAAEGTESEGNEEYEPCQPKQTARFSRQGIAINFAILCAGILLLCMTAPQRERLYVPGSLSHSHAQILDNTLVSDRCSLCHSNAHPDAMQGVLQDELCMACHTAHIPDATRRNPHDLSAAEIQLVSLREKDGKPVPANATVPESEKTFCASCHIEHHGDHHDLKVMTDRRCQSCHQDQFESFAIGHPQFESYPRQGQWRLAFDHKAHAGSYFGKKNQEFDCRGCHIDSGQEGIVGSVFRSVGFEKACASCHEASIQSELTNGWAFIQLPCLPEEVVENGPKELADWPEAARFDFDGEVSFATRLMLAADPDAIACIKRLPQSGKISEIDSEHREKAACGVSIAFRNVIREIANGGQAAWRARLESSLKAILDRDLNTHEIALLREVSVGLPPDLFRQIERQWFQSEAGSLASGTEDSSAPNRDVFQNVSTNINIQDELLGEEEDDLLMGGWDDEESSESKPAKLVKMNATTHLEEGGWYLDEDILSIRYVPRGHADRFLAAWAELVAIVERSRDGANEDEMHPWSNSDLTLSNAIPGSCVQCHQLGQSQDSDGLWQNWKSESRPANLRQFTKFNHAPHLSLPAVRECQYCHQFEDGLNSMPESGGLKTVLEKQSPASMQGSHFVAMQSRIKQFLNCEFKSISKNQCVACHRPDGAGDSCTQCHNYHVGSEGFSWKPE